MMDLGSAISTMTSRQPLGVFCDKGGGSASAFDSPDSRILTSKTWIGSASKNSCATITVNSSLAAGRERKSAVVSPSQNERLELTGRNLVYATPPAHGNVPEPSSLQLLLLLLAKRLRVLNEMDRSDWRRRVLRQGLEGLWVLETSGLLFLSISGDVKTHAQNVGEKGTATRTELDDPDALRSTLGGPLRDIPNGEELRVSREHELTVQVEQHNSTHLSKDLRDLGAGDEVA